VPKIAHGNEELKWLNSTVNDYSEIRASTGLHEWANDSTVKQLLSDIQDDEYFLLVESVRPGVYYDEFDGLMSEFLNSVSFQALSENEKATVARTLRVFFDENLEAQWGIEGEVSDDSLLGLKTLTKLPAKPADLLITCGLTLLDIDRIKPDLWADRPHLSGRRLEFANMIGVALMTNIDKPRHTVGQTNSYSYALSPSTEVEVMLGGDVHGDLRIAQREAYLEGAIDPAGNKVMYAPYGNSRAVAAYHSSEPELMECLIKHLHAVEPDSRFQRELIETAIEEFALAEQADTTPFGGAFADYGDEEGLGFYRDRLRSYFSDEKGRTRGGNDINEQIWSNIVVRPQSTERLQVRTEQEAFVMQNVRYNNDGEITETFKPIAVGSQQIGLFMRALLHQTAQGAGRTAPTALLKLLATRLELLS
jgi:hypothetical protein